MPTLLTIDELDMLESMFDSIPADEPFTIHSIRNDVRKAGKLNESDILKSDTSIDSKITDYLVQQNYAVRVGDLVMKSLGNIELTNFGRVLCACGSFLKYHQTEQRRLSTEEILQHVPRVIEMAPLYGEFTIDVEPPKLPQVINSDPLTPEGEREWQSIMRILDKKQMALDRFLILQRDEEVMQYLIAEGFMTNRHDIKSDGIIYRQLTDQGRKLKEFGSIEKYHEYEKNEQDKLRRQQSRDVYLFWIVLFGAVGTCISALYDGMQTFDFFGHHSTNWQYVAYFVSGFGLCLLLMLLLSLLRKTIGKDEMQ